MNVWIVIVLNGAVINHNASCGTFLSWWYWYCDLAWIKRKSDFLLVELKLYRNWNPNFPEAKFYAKYEALQETDRVLQRGVFAEERKLAIYWSKRLLLVQDLGQQSSGLESAMHYSKLNRSHKNQEVVLWRSATDLTRPFPSQNSLRSKEKQSCYLLWSFISRIWPVSCCLCR